MVPGGHAPVQGIAHDASSLLAIVLMFASCRGWLLSSQAGQAMPYLVELRPLSLPRGNLHAKTG
jgi:hypothetical protein